MTKKKKKIKKRI